MKTGAMIAIGVGLTAVAGIAIAAADAAQRNAALQKVPPGSGGADAWRIVGDSIGRGLQYASGGNGQTQGLMGYAAVGARVGDYTPSGRYRDALFQQGLASVPGGASAPRGSAAWPNQRLIFVLGTNDVAARTDPQALTLDVATLAGSYPRSVWVLPPSLPYDREPQLQAIKSALDGTAGGTGAPGSGVPWLDLASVQVPRDPSGVHTTPAGYLVWWRAVQAWMQALASHGRLP